MREEWRPVTFKEYAHLYHVSNLGRVKSLRRVASKTGGIMVAHPNTCGYPSLILSNKRKLKTVRTHILVARAFIGEPPPGLEVDHIDRDKTNNTLENLRYVSRSQNQLNHHKRFKRNPSERVSQYVGVCWYKRNKRWGASITVKGKRYFLGLFKEEIDAANARAAKAKELGV